jgi:hypothetical protein
MTWVVGLRSGFGYAAVMSDVQVTWRSQDKTLDCLQKVYPIAPYMVAGFAGSVRIGFALLIDLYRCVNFPGREEEGAVNTRIVAQRWWRRARKIFSTQEPSLRELGAQLLLAGISAGEREGDAQWDRSDVIILRSSEGFEPRYAKILEALSIGSGSNIDEYAKVLRNLHEWILPVAGASSGGLALASVLSSQLRQHPRAGISRYLNLAIARRGELRVSPVNFTEFSREGLPVNDSMPPIAKTWGEFERLAFMHGLEAPTALA